MIGAVGRRLVPYLIEATLIPTALFYLLLATTKELRWALVDALCLSYAAVVRVADPAHRAEAIGESGDPLGSDVRCRSGILRLFRRLSWLWAGTNAIAAGTTLALLLTVPVSVLVVSAAVAAWIVTCTGVVVTVVHSVTTLAVKA